MRVYCSSARLCRNGTAVSPDDKDEFAKDESYCKNCKNCKNNARNEQRHVQCDVDIKDGKNPERSSSISEFQPFSIRVY